MIIQQRRHSLPRKWGVIENLTFPNCVCNITWGSAPLTSLTCDERYAEELRKNQNKTPALQVSQCEDNCTGFLLETPDWSRRQKRPPTASSPECKPSPCSLQSSGKQTDRRPSCGWSIWLVWVLLDTLSCTTSLTCLLYLIICATVL